MQCEVTRMGRPNTALVISDADRVQVRLRARSVSTPGPIPPGSVFAARRRSLNRRRALRSYARRKLRLIQA